MQKDCSFITVKRNITNEYSDYHFHFYLGNHTDQTFEYHRECYPSYTYKKDLQGFQTNVQNKRKLEAADFQSTPQKGSRVPDVASKVISAYSVYF